MKSITNKIRLATLMAAATLLAAGCEKAGDNEPGVRPMAAQVSGSIVAGTAAAVSGAKSAEEAQQQTRAAGTAWAVDDRIGVTATSVGTTAYANVQYRATTPAGEFEAVSTAGSDDTIYFRDAEDVTFTAYYPYTGVNGTTAGNAGVIYKTITTADQAEIDFLFATATGSSARPDVNFQFRHCMSRLVLNFLPGDGIAVLGDLKYIISPLALEGTFNTATGETAVAEALKGDLILSVPYNAAAMSSTQIVFPQQAIGAGIQITMSSRIYKGRIEFPEHPANGNVRGLLPGYSYTYNIKVNDSGLTTSPVNIDDWEGGNPIDGGAFLK